MEYQVNRRLCNSNSHNQKPNHSDKNPRRRITWLTGSKIFKNKNLGIKTRARRLAWIGRRISRLKGGLGDPPKPAVLGSIGQGGRNRSQRARHSRKFINYVNLKHRTQALYPGHPLEIPLTILPTPIIIQKIIFHFISLILRRSWVQIPPGPHKRMLFLFSSADLLCLSTQPRA